MTKQDDFTRQVTQDYRLTTAEILYRLPDYPDFLQTYIWQDYDVVPRFPVLTRFLSFWEREIEGPLHSVTVASRSLIAPVRFDVVRCLFVMD
ncbi:MAG: hypothetical protein KDJ15_06850 [Alphaproteobacteria bacterium]|nr:hypothetical protein [Alphaproteobacteria bacterium]